MHSLQHACSGNVEADWGASGSCHSDCDLASLLEMQDASPVADNAGKIPALSPRSGGQCSGSLHCTWQQEQISGNCMAPLPSLVGGAVTQKYVSGPCVFPNLMRHALRRLLPAHLQPMHCQNSVSSTLSTA